MFPFIFEWDWDLGHWIFMGLFYMVLVVIGVGIHWVAIKTVFEFITGKDVDHH